MCVHYWILYEANSEPFIDCPWSSTTVLSFSMHWLEVIREQHIFFVFFDIFVLYNFLFCSDICFNSAFWIVTWDTRFRALLSSWFPILKLTLCQSGLTNSNHTGIISVSSQKREELAALCLWIESGATCSFKI